ncbi:hypothetical protein SAMN05660841_03965 [Sphingobacterium nematocida]|uniref:Phage abortive infection protein n=1 Tax=Sphingobacterium nematocida TaxID=1513896 RepID=A0A1T5GDL3_9SPHI|nr:hypothetical protein [Sphingobacterium nematocida]SKC06479.1 hypothetical protein SAMN05660841_03965 [Sphingobacterium nematocida]
MGNKSDNKIIPIVTGIMGFFGGIALVNNWLVLNKEFPESEYLKVPFTPDAWGNVADWTMVIITIITAIYLIKTFKSQREQIEIQRKEIEDNNSNTEFSRILDLMYRQVEVSNQKYNDVTKHPNAPKINPTPKIEDVFTKIPTFHWLFRIYYKDLELIDNFLSKTNLKKEEKDLLVSTFINNVDKDMIALKGQFDFVYIGTSTLMNVRVSYESYLRRTIINSGANHELKEVKIEDSVKHFDQLIELNNQINKLHTKYNIHP